MSELKASGKCIVLSAPSGAGKTTIARRLLKDYENFEFSISACSRAPRVNEVDGKDYYFIGVEGFKERISKDDFIEWEEVYTDHFYGTLKKEVERIWEKGNIVVFDVDVKGGVNLKKIFGEQALSVFVLPPSIDDLMVRLNHRSTESKEEMELRFNKAEYEISFAPKFDVSVVNEVLETAVEEVKGYITKFLAQ